MGTRKKYVQFFFFFFFYISQPEFFKGVHIEQVLTNFSEEKKNSFLLSHFKPGFVLFKHKKNYLIKIITIILFVFFFCFACLSRSWFLILIWKFLQGPDRFEEIVEDEALTAALKLTLNQNHHAWCMYLQNGIRFRTVGNWTVKGVKFGVRERIVCTHLPGITGS